MMLAYALLTFSSLFAIVDPFAAVPAFLAMTAQEGEQERRRTSQIACLVSWLVITVFAAIGPSLFRLFGITLAAFEIAGGLILLLSSLDMLRAKRSPLNETEEETKEGMAKADVAITPLAIPMLAGPGGDHNGDRPLRPRQKLGQDRDFLCRDRHCVRFELFNFSRGQLGGPQARPHHLKHHHAPYGAASCRAWSAIYPHRAKNRLNERPSP